MISEVERSWSIPALPGTTEDEKDQRLPLFGKRGWVCLGHQNMVPALTVASPRHPDTKASTIQYDTDASFPFNLSELSLPQTSKYNPISTRCDTSAIGRTSSDPACRPR